MPKANATHTTGRRRFLEQLATASIASTQIACADAHHANTDAKLIALCHRFDAVQDEILSFYEGGLRYVEDEAERDRLIEPFEDQQAELLEAMCVLRAMTPEGHVARARTFVKWWPHALLKIGPGNCWDERMVGSLVRDMAAI
ncbi:hypothetical protein [Novacetimonas sp. GS1]|uniref:hypothetical protein n=1 Tax=Novacetimonas sp. GS1 TaxID=3119990 RepID=UPI002FCCE961